LTLSEDDVWYVKLKQATDEIEGWKQWNGVKTRALQQLTNNDVKLFWHALCAFGRGSALTVIN